MCAIVVKAVYEHDNKVYPRIYLHSCYFNCVNDEDGYVCINVVYAIFGMLLIKNLTIKNIFAMVVMICQ